MSRVRVQGLVATTDVIPSFGRAILDEDAVRRIYDALRHNPPTMFGQHDERNQLESELKAVELRRTETGALSVWIELDADEADISAYHGFSIGWFENDLAPVAKSGLPEMKFGADALHFTDAERQIAAQRLGARFEVYGGRYYQLALDGPATVVLLFMAETIRALPAAVLAHLLFESLHHLLPSPNRTRPTLFKFGIWKQPSGESEVMGLLETSDPEALRRALDTLLELAAEQPGQFELDLAEKKWRRIARKTGRSPGR